MSKLKAYVTQRKGAIRLLARAAEVSDAQMSRIVHGERGASLAVALAIADATNGLITPSDVAAAKVNTPKAKKARSGRGAR